MASSLFRARTCYPGLEDVPALDDSGVLDDCAVPPPLRPVTVCPPFALPPPVPVVDRALHISVTRGPVSGRYDWREEVPDGDGGWAAGPRSGLISRYRWATEINGVVVAPGPSVYPATLVGGTGRCVFIAGLPSVTTTVGAVLYVQLTAYDAAAGAYDWRQVAATAPGVWSPTGVAGSATAGTGVSEQNGLPAVPDGTTVHKASRDTAGNLVTNALELGSGVIALTPAGGIPAAADAAHPGSATVAFYYIDASGRFTAIGASGVMWNMDPDDVVGGNVYVQGKVTPGLQVLHDYEICPAGG